MKNNIKFCNNLECSSFSMISLEHLENYLDSKAWI